MLDDDYENNDILNNIPTDVKRNDFYSNNQTLNNITNNDNKMFTKPLFNTNTSITSNTNTSTFNNSTNTYNIMNDSNMNTSITNNTDTNAFTSNTNTSTLTKDDTNNGTKSSFVNFFKDKFNKSNSCLGFIGSIFEKHKFIILFIVVVIMITFIEITIATNISDCAYPLMKSKIMKIKPDCISLNDDEFIYVYNTNTFKRDEVMKKAKIPENYKKQTVTEHITKQILKPINSIKESWSNMFTTSTPINALSNNILSSVKIKDLVNPLNSFNSLASSWNVFYPNHLKLSCFIADGKIYFG